MFKDKIGDVVEVLNKVMVVFSGFRMFVMFEDVVVICRLEVFRVEVGFISRREREV